ncbi:uncharacterized protein LOC125778203 isoform X2 [Bactrocera dorsalis]|uniref:Uncharacterized protein LOC125778203 isoform X2 n=1 Tax=Bactrocera dorsalis TaxID=27457 RepID=A0ABM3JNF7_BACDO|nr:uncharacterized protein LOC125778203 isoform X2 [Bactrocera dorsalis]
MAREVKVNCATVAIFAILLLTQNLGCSEAKFKTHSNRKSNSGLSSRNVIKSYRTQSSAGNSQPPSAAGSGASNTPPIGWNVPRSQGYPASGTNVYTPITATNTKGVQSSYPGATYNFPGSIPAGATYHSPGSVPAGTTYHSPGSYPAGGNPYSSPGQVPVNGGYYPAGGRQYPSAGVPAGTYVAPGTALPQGAVLFPSPQQQTPSGLKIGAGLAVGVIGGVIGHELTKTHTRVESATAAPARQPGSAENKIIIINNGRPCSVTTTNAAGATVITTGVVGENAKQPMPAPAPTAAPAIPNVPLAPIGDNNATKPTPAPRAALAESAPAAAPQAAPEQPRPGGLICVPVRVNDTDPADSTKMIEVEKIVCYPAPPPPPPAPVAGAQMNRTAPVMPPASEGSAPLVPMCPSQRSLQANRTRARLLSDNASVKTSGAGAWLNYAACNAMTTVLLPLFVAFYILNRVY